MGVATLTGIHPVHPFVPSSLKIVNDYTILSDYLT